jgi:hypothetical protein
LVPVQHPEEAAEELRRVAELGLFGGGFSQMLRAHLLDGLEYLS